MKTSHETNPVDQETVGTDRPHPNTIATVFRFARPLWPQMSMAVICALISVVGGLIPFLGLYRIIMMHLDGGIPPFQEVLFWAAVCIGGYFIKVLFFALATTLSHRCAYTILKDIRYAMSQKLMRTPLGKVLGRTSGDFKNTIVDRVETIELPLAHIIPEGISNIFLPLGVFIFVIAIDWRMALALLVTVPLGFALSMLMMRSYNSLYDDFMKANTRVNSVIVEYIEGIEVVKAFNQSPSSYAKFVDTINSFRDFTLAWYQSTWSIRSLVGAILPTTLLGVVPAGVLLYIEGTLTIASFTLCVILALAIVPPIAWFTVAINEWKDVQYAVHAANEILTIPELPDALHEATLKDYRIELAGIGFSYTGNHEHEVLHDLDLSIDQGAFTALVGPSGSGKSTIARLIARFWDADRGSVTIGGVDIKEIPLDQLAKTVSFVTQDNFLFNCSIFENIRLGRPEATEADVFAAASAACCDEFILKLEKGYSTPAGEAGKKLSGGEKQRISIARAILKDAPIVILDEATAFTDPENEDKIQKSIAALTKGKTLLVIAHRLSTIKNADKIIVIEGGTVVSQGTQEELLRDSPLYRTMWEKHIRAKAWAPSTNTGRALMREAG